jgi:insertion element IS1 protein InsB
VDLNTSRKMVMFTTANKTSNARPADASLSVESRVIAEDQRPLVAYLVREKICLHGICRAVGVSIRWLMDFMNACVEALPDHLDAQSTAYPHEVIRQRLDVEADEMSSFVGKMANKPWLWLAMDTQTRQVIAFHAGDHSRESAKQLWANIPAVYRKQARFSTDCYEAYTGVIPAAQHQAMTKLARTTNHLERFNNTLRQRVSRLMRATLASSKKLANHSGAIRYFICYGNLTRAAALHG